MQQFGVHWCPVQVSNPGRPPLVTHRHYAAVIVFAALVYLVPLLALRVCVAFGWHA